jgi:hypothetical protein
MEHDASVEWPSKREIGLFGRQLQHDASASAAHTPLQGLDGPPTSSEHRLLGGKLYHLFGVPVTESARQRHVMPFRCEGHIPVHSAFKPHVNAIDRPARHASCMRDGGRILQAQRVPIQPLPCCALALATRQA